MAPGDFGKGAQPFPALVSGREVARAGMKWGLPRRYQLVTGLPALIVANGRPCFPARALGHQLSRGVARVQQGHTYSGDTPTSRGHHILPHQTCTVTEQATACHLPGAGADCVETRKGTSKPHNLPKTLLRLISK